MTKKVCFFKTLCLIKNESCYKMGNPEGHDSLNFGTKEKGLGFFWLCDQVIDVALLI